jgi:hypothetical protein
MPGSNKRTLLHSAKFVEGSSGESRRSEGQEGEGDNHESTKEHLRGPFRWTMPYRTRQTLAAVRPRTACSLAALKLRHEP